MLSRRRVIGLGGGLAAALVVRPAPAAAPVEIVMHGDARGAHVWFDPVGLRLRPGDTVRWTNADPGNSHTATAYHPANYDRLRRIPAGGDPWDSGYLLPDESFAVTLTVEGVYDYYCVPHEHAGMVGRIVVGDPDADAWMQDEATGSDLPAAALDGLPAVAEIVQRGIVRRG